MSGVLDASVLLAVLNGEQGADAGLELLPGGVVSAVNLSEVVAKLQRNGSPDHDILAILERLECEIVPFDSQQAVAAGLMWREVKQRGLSFGDRACLALARSLNLPCFTTERVWSGLMADIDIRQIR